MNDDEVEDALKKINGSGASDLEKTADSLQRILDHVRGGIAHLKTEIARREEANEVLRRHIDQIKRENAAHEIEAELNHSPSLTPTHQAPVLLQ